MSGCAGYQVINEPTYTQKKVTYRVTDNKPVTGIVEQFQGGVVEYRTYDQGKLLDLKTVSTRDNTIVSHIKYDSMGLMHGDIISFRGCSRYRHGVLHGEHRSFDQSQIINYRDGILHGERVIDGKTSFFQQGLITSSQKRNSTSEKEPVSSVWAVEPPADYTGEVFFTPGNIIPTYMTPALEIRGYKQGELRYLKHYSRRGLKLAEYHLVNQPDYAFLKAMGRPKLSKAVKYKNGRLIRTYSEPFANKTADPFEGTISD